MIEDTLMENPWQILNTREMVDTPWIRVVMHDVIHPGSEKGMYTVTHFKNLAIGILPLDEEMNTWVVGQFRFPLGQYSWEMPEGGGPIGIDPLESARRELKEETGIEARRWTLLNMMHLSNSTTDEVAYLYLARDLSFGESDPEPGEQLEIKKIPFEELYRMVINGEVTDAMTVATVLRVKLMVLEGKL